MKLLETLRSATEHIIPMAVPIMLASCSPQKSQEDVRDEVRAAISTVSGVYCDRVRSQITAKLIKKGFKEDGEGNLTANGFNVKIASSEDDLFVEARDGSGGLVFGSNIGCYPDICCDSPEI